MDSPPPNAPASTAPASTLSQDVDFSYDSPRPRPAVHPREHRARYVQEFLELTDLELLQRQEVAELPLVRSEDVEDREPTIVSHDALGCDVVILGHEHTTAEDRSSFLLPRILIFLP